MEEGGVANHVDVGVIRDELAQALHGELVRLGLAHVEGDLVLKVLPVVGDGVVHVDRIPDQIGEKADGVIVERGGGGNLHAAGFLVVAPCVRGEGLARRAVDHFPPAADVVAGVDLHQLGGNALHERDGERLSLAGGVEARHDVALLHLVRVGLGPCVVLAGGVVGGVDFRAHAGELFGEFGAVAVADGVGSPFFEDLNGFGNNVEVGRDGNTAGGSFLVHGFLPSFFLVWKRARAGWACAPLPGWFSSRERPWPPRSPDRPESPRRASRRDPGKRCRGRRSHSGRSSSHTRRSAR